MIKALIIAIVLILVAVGTVLFHFMSPWWWTPIASNWGNVDHTIIITFWVTGVVFVGIILFTAYCVFKYRYREERRAQYEPENKKLEVWLTVLTALGVAVMLAPGLWVWNDFVTVPQEAEDNLFEVVGQQWGWSYRFPGQDGILGTTDTKFINFDNPFGVDPQDPNGQDDILVDDSEVYIPVDRPIKVLLRSIDVLHDFYVPQFRAKMDLVPGMVTYFWFMPTKKGTYEILCFELCGVGHYSMRGSVVVEDQSVFQEWLQEQPTFAQSQAALNGTGEDDESVSRLDATILAGSRTTR